MPERVVVRLPNWLGDTVMALPALRAVRETFPDARVLCAGPWTAILAGQGLADVLVAYPRGWGARLPAADAVREFAPTLALLLTNSFESALAACYWRARRRVGFGDGGREWLLTDALSLPEPRLHQVDEYVLLAERAGAVVASREPVLVPPAPTSEARQEARRLLANAGVEADEHRPLFAIHLGAAYGSSKLWPAARVAELVPLLQSRGGQPVLLGPSESLSAAARVATASPIPSLVGRDSPALLPALLAEASVLVGGDTGVTHLAAAVGTPVVAIFGPTDPRLSAPRGPAAAVVRHAVPCAPCFYRVCPIDHPCLRDVAAETVAAQVWSLVRRVVTS